MLMSQFVFAKRKCYYIIIKLAYVELQEAVYKDMSLYISFVFVYKEKP